MREGEFAVLFILNICRIDFFDIFFFSQLSVVKVKSLWAFSCLYMGKKVIDWTDSFFMHVVLYLVMTLRMLNKI